MDEDEFIDALWLQAELMNPFFGAYTFVDDPSPANFGKIFYLPGIFAATGALLYGATVPGVRPGVAHAMGSAAGYGRQLINRATMWTLQQTGRAVVQSSPVTVPAAVAATGAYYYEKEVNQRVRDAHPSGSSTPWYGPFASGFGSAVP